MQQVAIYLPRQSSRDPKSQLETCESLLNSNLDQELTADRYTQDPMPDIEELFDNSQYNLDLQEFSDLWNAINEGHVDYLVVDTLNRFNTITREMSLEDFLQSCLQNETQILSPEAEITVSPTSTAGEEIAQAIGSQIARWVRQTHIDAEERSELIQEGITEAEESQKWVGRPPTGFEIDAQGRLSVEHEEFRRVFSAVQDVESGDSIRDAATNHDLSHSTLQKIVSDGQRKTLYLHGSEGADGHDRRILSALRQYEASEKPPYD